MTDQRYTVSVGRRAVSAVLICTLLLSAQVCQASTNDEISAPQPDSVLKIHLPREVEVDDNQIRLGQIGIVRGRQALVTKASEIPLGRVPGPRQSFLVDRPMILSRLACSGIPASDVVLTGAQKVSVKWQQQVIKADKFVEVAGAFLKESPIASSAAEFEPARLPDDLAVSVPAAHVDFSACSVESGASNMAKVRIVADANGKQLGTRDVTFLLKYRGRRMVTAADIPAGIAISHENTKIEEVLSDEPESAEWRPPYGLIARRQLAKGTVIKSAMVGAARPQVVLKRNETVLIRIQIPGLLVTAMGKAMQDGRIGEYIKVRNIDSKRIILARVNKDATVEPVI
jgi:flagella basal body P-ring formation protein FlgA